MSDLRGFTSLSEGLPAEDVVAMVNIYLETTTNIILKYQGTIDELIGDGILVILELLSSARMTPAVPWPAPWTCNWPWPQ